MYAKLGGTPWLIESNRVITHELVFGLGSAVISKGRLGQKEQVVGITTVFAGDGNYMLSNLSTAVPMSEYKAALLDSLRETVMKVKRAMNWEAGSRVRLIFHAFKPMKNNEADAVNQLMEELGEYDVEYAFVHVVNQHPYVLFDEAQPGIYDWENKKNGKGNFAPRGNCSSVSLSMKYTLFDRGEGGKASSRWHSLACFASPSPRLNLERHDLPCPSGLHVFVSFVA